MKKYIFILNTILATNFVYAQVGVNTKSPQSTFHIDGQNTPATTNPDTGAPSVAQQVDDVIVLPNGNMGLGTITPTSKLEIKTTGTAATPVTGFKLTDGNEDANKYLRSDANGVGTWAKINIDRSVVNGTVSTRTLPNSSAANPDPVLYSGILLNLTPGKWIVNSGLTIFYGGGGTSANLGESFMLHAYLSSDQNIVTNTNFNFIGNKKFTGRIVKNTFNNSPSLLQGSNFIEVLPGQTATIYLVIENKSAPKQQWKFDTNNWENYLYAIPVN